MAWTGFTSAGFTSDTAGWDYLQQANTDQARAHREATANRAKQEEHAARETAKKQAREARQEANRSAAAARRADRAKAREKSDRASRLLYDDVQPVKEAMQVDETPSTPSVPSIGEPIDYWQPTLTSGQGQALTALGTSPTVVEIAGARIGTETNNLIAQIKEDVTDAGGYFSPYWDKIVMPTSTFEGRNLDQVTRHELLHRLTNELMDSGVLQQIPLPEMQSILEKFDNFQGEATVADFIKFLQMNSPTDESGVIPATGRYAQRWYQGEQFDPRMRTAGWDASGMDTVGDKVWDDMFLGDRGLEGIDSFNFLNPRYGAYDMSGAAPWTDSSTKGKGDFEDWMAFQRELPSEKYGGAVVGAGAGETLPWGPATVNFRWMDTPSGFKKVPVSTGASQGGLEAQESYFDEKGDWWGDIQSQTGLANWSMGDEHALLAAQAARFDKAGVPDYRSSAGESGDYYGDLARFNRAAALKAHPDSRIRQITEAGLPDIVLDKLTEILSSGGDEVWGEAGSYEGAVKYITQLVQQYQSGQLENNLVAQN